MKNGFIYTSKLLTRNVFKEILMNSLWIHFFSILGNYFLTIFRDKYIKQICWSPKVNCQCTELNALYFLIFGVSIQMLCPFCLVVALMHFLKQSLLNSGKNQICLFFLFLLTINSPYIIIYYLFDLHESPRVFVYFINIIFMTVWAFYYVKSTLKLSLLKFIVKMRYSLYMSYIGVFYFFLMTYLMPEIYNFFGKDNKIEGKNYFQLFIVVLSGIYEVLYSFLLVKMSQIIEENPENDSKDTSTLIFITKYYYVVFYSLRIGNILYLEYTDWGFYFQMFFFLIFIFEHTSGISLFSIIILKPLLRMFGKKQQVLNEYINYNNLILNNWRKWLGNQRDKIRSKKKRKIKLNFFDKRMLQVIQNQKNLKNEEYCRQLKKSQEKIFFVFCYQKVEFFFIYVPILLQLWLLKVWQSPEPYYEFTVGCSFEITKINFQGYSIISLIVIDTFASLIILFIMHYKGKMNELYQCEKVNWYKRMFIYMGYQMTFEYWVGHFSTYQLIMQNN